MLKVGHQLGLLGQNVVDFEERVDIPRLKTGRLERLQREMAKADLGGLVLFDPHNIRYATGRRNPGAALMRGIYSYIIVPQEGTPYVPELHHDCAPLEDQEGFAEYPAAWVRKKGTYWEFFDCWRNAEEAARLWGQRIRDQMSELGIGGQRRGWTS